MIVLRYMLGMFVLTLLTIAFGLDYLSNAAGDYATRIQRRITTSELASNRKGK